MFFSSFTVLISYTFWTHSTLLVHRECEVFQGSFVLFESSYANNYCHHLWGNQGFWISLRQLNSSMSEVLELRNKAHPYFRPTHVNHNKYSAEKKKFTVTSLLLLSPHSYKTFTIHLRLEPHHYVTHDAQWISLKLV